MNWVATAPRAHLREMGRRLGQRTLGALESTLYGLNLLYYTTYHRPILDGLRQDLGLVALGAAARGFLQVADQARELKAVADRWARGSRKVERSELQAFESHCHDLVRGLTDQDASLNFARKTILLAGDDFGALPQRLDIFQKAASLDDLGERCQDDRHIAVVLRVADDAATAQAMVEQVACICEAQDLPLVVEVASRDAINRRFAHSGVTRVVPATNNADELIHTVYEAIRFELEHRGVLYLLTQDGALERRIGAALEQEFAIVAFDDVQKLVRQWITTPPDLVVLDCSVPGLDTMQLCRCIASKREATPVPVTLVVENSDVLREEALEAGADDVWIGEIPPAEIRRRTETTLELHRLRSRMTHDRQVGRPGSGPSVEGSVVRVLLVDDSRTMRDVLAHHMRQRNWLVTAVEDGRAATEQLAQFEFDLVVFDLDVPHRSGFDLLRELHEDPRFRRTRVVVLTAGARDETIMRAFALGADDFVSKPVNPHVLMARLNRFVRSGV